MQKALAIKAVIIAIIGFIVLIPVAMVEYKIEERQGHLYTAKSSIANSWTGEQSIISPILVIPYTKKTRVDQGFYTNTKQAIISVNDEQHTEFLLPSRSASQIQVTNSHLFKGIYKLPIYTSEISINATFDQSSIENKLQHITHHADAYELSDAYIAIHIADMRGIEQQPELSINGSPIALHAGSQMSQLASGLHAYIPVNQLKNTPLDIKLNLKLRGMDAISFTSVASESQTTMQSNWPHPEFTGLSLPHSREISSEGFSATWKTSQYSLDGQSLTQDCLIKNHCNALMRSASGVKFIDPVNVYLQSERATKYAMLFIGLSFICFFIFEHMCKVRIHPIQYAFVGLAIAVFYLLLISLAEHIQFYWAYIIGVIACSALLLFYVRFMLRSLRYAACFSGMIVILYGLLFVIIRTEDFALLMGSILVFGVLSALMYITREIDWYALSSNEEKV